jgi:hypothetical protein
MQRSILVVVAILVAGLLAGCRQEEDHPLVLGNGNYTGTQDTGLTGEQLSELNNRVDLQGASNVTGGGASGAAEAAPGEQQQAPAASDKELDQRLQKQAGQ